MTGGKSVTVCVRVDSSARLGLGHLMRCKALTDALREQGLAVFYICAHLPGNSNFLLKKAGYRVFEIGGGDPIHWQKDAEETKATLAREGGAHWLIVDHYGLARDWEIQIRPLVKKIMVIDDLGDRPHDCDLLLNQNLDQECHSRYNALVPSYCQQFLGPGYALLRPEFIAARSRLRQRHGTISRILICFGGTDPPNGTAKALEAIALLNRPDIAVDVVVGEANPVKEEIKALCRDIPNVAFYCQVENMAQLMAKADLAIGAGGSSNWERCSLGLPAIALIIAQNQYRATVALEKAGAIRNLGWIDEVGGEDLVQALREFLADPTLVIRMGEKALELMEGNSGPRQGRLVRAIMEGC